MHTNLPDETIFRNSKVIHKPNKTSLSSYSKPISIIKIKPSNMITSLTLDPANATTNNNQPQNEIKCRCIIDQDLPTLFEAYMNLTPKTMAPNTPFYLQKHQSLHKNTPFSPSSITHKSKTAPSKNKNSKPQHQHKISPSKQTGNHNTMRHNTPYSDLHKTKRKTDPQNS
jgi:hypothetical protein